MSTLNDQTFALMCRTQEEISAVLESSLRSQEEQNRRLMSKLDVLVGGAEQVVDGHPTG